MSRKYVIFNRKITIWKLPVNEENTHTHNLMFWLFGYLEFKKKIIIIYYCVMLKWIFFS